MAGTGAGPSRRSHTKSRKGCKTCKRRHIRCDETFPHCRNCAKHQVRCDYMDIVGSENENQHSPEQPSLVLSPGSEQRIDVWQQTGSFPYPELQVFPLPQTHEYSRIELRLIHHLCAVSNDLLMSRTTSLTMWTDRLPKFLSIASTYPYVMHALLSFSANHLAWVSSSRETRNLCLHHGSIALRGLHEAIGSFSHANADAVLAASVLLFWQATDWQSWSSLRVGIQSVLSAMQAWKHESLFTEHIAEEDLVASAFRIHRRRSSINSSERAVLLQNVVYSLQRLQIALVGQEAELSWVNQLLAYVQQAQRLNPAQTPEEQFNYLYQLRKWLLWIPVSLLQRQGGQGPAMLTLAHFYATALALEPLFPDLGSSFCSAMALPPLEAIISVTNAMQSRHVHDTSSMEIASLMQYPQQTALSYRNRAIQYTQLGAQPENTMAAISPKTLNYTSIGILSPALTPSTPAYSTSQPPSSVSTPFLEVPGSQPSFTFGTQTWGAMPSPGFPPQVYTSQEGHIYDAYDGISLSNFSGGFVPTAPIWT